MPPAATATSPPTTPGGPLLDGVLGIAIPQAGKADKASAARWPDGGVLDIWAAFDGIAQFFQLLKKGLVGKGMGDGGVHVLPDQAPRRGLAGFLCRPFGVMRGAVSRLDDGKTVAAADLIGDAPNIRIIGGKIVPELLSIQKRNGIK